MRKVGSGFSTRTARAFADLVCGLVNEDRLASRRARVRLHQEFEKGRCGIPDERLQGIAVDFISNFPAPIVIGEAEPEDGLGDMKFVDDSGELWWVELKAQTTKVSGDLLQSDWVRDYTDFVGYLGLEDSDTDEVLGGWEMESVHFDDWPAAELWIADLLLLDSSSKKRSASVTSLEELLRFAMHKFFLHLANDQVALYRMSEIPAIQRAAAGEFSWTVERLPKSLAIRVSTSDTASRSNFDFIYYLYPEVGRHKLHPRTLSESEPVWRLNV